MTTLVQWTKPLQMSLSSEKVMSFDLARTVSNNFVCLMVKELQQCCCLMSRVCFCCSKKVQNCIYFQRKLHLCTHLTAKDLTQPIFVCADLAKSQDFLHFHLQLSSDIQNSVREDSIWIRADDAYNVGEIYRPSL